MHNSTTVLQQLLALLPEQEFQTFVGQHNADRYVKTYSCRNQLTVMLYAQITRKDSLRDIETGLRILDSTWNGLGLRSVARSTMAYANEHRPAAIYESLFYVLVKQCEGLLPAREFSFKNPMRAFDSTTIDLCLSLFDWAKFRKAKGAIKLHTSFDIHSQIPDLIDCTNGKVGDITALKKIDFSQYPPGTIFIIDRGYYDYALLWKIVRTGHHFVIRRKSNAQTVRLAEHRTPAGNGVLKDERIAFVLDKAMRDYPADVRMVTYHDTEHDVLYEFLTDMFHLSASNIALVYKCRWDIELFFKWLKQNLKIQTFFGTSLNAVHIQIWIAMIYYVLLKWLSAVVGKPDKILELSRMLREVCLQPFPLISVLCCTPKTLKKLRVHEGPQMTFL